MEQVGVVAGHRVDVRSLREGRAGRGQGGDDAVEGALERVGVGILEGSLDGGLPHQVSALDRRGGPVERLGRVGSRVRARAGRQRDSGEDQHRE